ncbi:MAG TPA: ATP-binding protein [Blastocatellia bacterium]|nr:ATP-binding protein [Blastocatellia bacterium]
MADIEERVNLLLVDDRPENLMALQVSLEPLGQNLVCAGSGIEALRRVLEGDFAAIVLDVQMPGMDGFETAALIRERERSHTTPIIFLTAIGKSEPEVFKGYAVGAVDYIFKPFIPEILRAKTSVFVELFKTKCALERQLGETQRLNAELAASEAALRRSNRQLETANKGLEAFSYSVSHDLRAPLRSIDGFSRVLLDDYADVVDDRGKDYLSRVRAAAQRMAQLIDDILGLSRVTRTEMLTASVDLTALAESVLRELRQTNPSRRVEVVIAPEMVTTGDRQLLRIVLDNLLGNAWKFTGKREHATIEVGAERHAGATVFFVRDNGAGFDMRHAGKLFGAFQRLHGTSEFEGTGIGLATVQRVIHRHGGRVWAEVDGGATFYFTVESSPQEAAKDA